MTDKSGAECGAIDAPDAISEPATVQNAVQHEPATDRIKQNPAGTQARSCGVVRAGSDSQGGEGGIRTTSKNAGKTSVSKQGGAECGAAGVRKDSVDADLQKLIETWPRLSETVQAVILKLVHDSVSVSTTS